MGTFRVETAGETLIVLMDRPPVNALTAEMLEAGVAFFAELAADPPAGGVVLTGAGPTYTAGVDRKIVADASRDYRRRLVWAVNGFAAALYQLPCALVSAVNGHAVGAGGIACLASDWTVAASGPAKIGLPEAKAGLPFPQVPLIVMAHGLDPVWRRRLALSSMLLSPAEAVGAGLVDEVVAADVLLDTAVARARDMQAQPAFAAIKADLRRAALAEIGAVFAAAMDPLAEAVTA